MAVWVVAVAAGSTLVAGATASCTSSKSAVGLAAGCSLNSDCNSPLVCVFSLCHEACEQQRDCPAGQLCVASDMGHVCELPGESSCANGGTCPSSLSCVGGACATACDVEDAGSACVQGQACQAGGCISTLGGGSSSSSGSGSGGGSGSGSGSGGGVDAQACVPTVGDAGPLGFVPSNFDPTHLAVHDSAPEGGIDWTNPPDASCENSQTLAQCLPMVNPGAVEAYNAASVTMSDGTLASIYVVNNFVVESNAVLNLSSDPYNPYPVIIAAKGTVQILGTINGYGGVVGGQAGPGAFPVYNSGDTSLGPGGGAGGPTGSYPSSSPAGGSFCGTGGVGGGVAPLAPPGDPYGTSSLVPLIGGSGGGYYGTTGYNGLGGGALQITSGKSILIGNVGVINMGGGNDYGGGGSGGAILLEAPAITVQGVLAANGASGVAESSGTAGQFGQPNDQPATPPTGSVGGAGSAGVNINGAAGVLGDAGAAVSYNGSGGGGAGWIRLNSACPATIGAQAVVSPYLSPMTPCATVGALSSP